MCRRLLMLTARQARRLVVAVVGGTILLAGVATLLLPGPAFIVISLGLAILATEFAWARWLLSRHRATLALPASHRRAGHGRRGQPALSQHRQLIARQRLLREQQLRSLVELPAILAQGGQGLVEGRRDQLPHRAVGLSMDREAVIQHVAATLGVLASDGARALAVVYRC